MLRPLQKMVTMPRILQLNGLSMCDFADEKAALKAADDLVDMSAEEHGFQKSELDHPNPLLAKHWYVHSQGRKRVWSQTEEKSLEKTTDIKSAKTLVDSKLFMEGLESSSSNAVPLKHENPTFTSIQNSIDAFRYIWLDSIMFARANFLWPPFQEAG